MLYVLCAGLFGLCWASHAFQNHKENILPSELEQVDLSVTGYVQGMPVTRDSNVSFTLRIESSGDSMLEIGALLKLSCYRCDLELKPDQRWRLTLRLKQPHGYASWGAYDYEKYLFRHQIVAKGYVRNKGVNQLLENESWSIDQLRWSIAQKLKSHESLSGVGLAVMLALGIGDKSSLNQTQSDVFQGAGVSHLMAISGLHLSLIHI